MVKFGDKRMPERFWSRVRVDGECWIWTGSMANGYGFFFFDKRMRYAHRIAFTVLVRLPGDGKVIDHKCKQKLCVNPAHLDEVSQRQNVLLGDAGKRNREKTHCPQGHEYSEANTYTSKGKRQCRECRRIANRPSVQRIKAGLEPGRQQKPRL